MLCRLACLITAPLSLWQPRSAGVAAAPPQAARLCRVLPGGCRHDRPCRDGRLSAAAASTLALIRRLIHRLSAAAAAALAPKTSCATGSALALIHHHELAPCLGRGAPPLCLLHTATQRDGRRAAELALRAPARPGGRQRAAGATPCRRRVGLRGRPPLHTVCACRGAAAGAEWAGPAARRADCTSRSALAASSLRPERLEIVTVLSEHFS